MIETRKPAAALTGSNGDILIRKTPGVCGGDACIRETRIMVWLLVDLQRQGATQTDILEAYPTLTPEDLQAAWDYYRQNQMEIDDAIASQEVED